MTSTSAAERATRGSDLMRCYKMSKSRRRKHEPTVVERAREARSFCDPECEGRCRECPNDLIRDLIERIEELERGPQKGWIREDGRE